MQQDAQVRVNITIVGLVQGVFFRASTLEKAQGLNLTGYVKNLSDGSVEIVAEGQRYALEDLVAWCHHGPQGAEVQEVFTRYAPANHEFKTFMVER